MAKDKEVGMPPRPRWGEPVPKGGTSCNNCEYLKDREKMICGESNFIKWNGSNKIPAKSPDEYCSIWWEAAPGTKSEGRDVRDVPFEDMGL